MKKMANQLYLCFIVLDIMGSSRSMIMLLWIANPSNKLIIEYSWQQSGWSGWFFSIKLTDFPPRRRHNEQDELFPL